MIYGRFMEIERNISAFDHSRSVGSTGFHIAGSSLLQASLQISKIASHWTASTIACSVSDIRHNSRSTAAGFFATVLPRIAIGT